MRRRNFWVLIGVPLALTVVGAGVALCFLTLRPHGTPVVITLALLPVGWECKASSRVRLAVSGGDRDHIVQAPQGHLPRLRIQRGIARPSRLVLPIRSGA
jgi:hypothetical protein